jgi:large subunit ribosomal protein L2
MNPVDHPHGGGEGKKSKPVKQKTPWGKRAKYVKTVKKKEYVKIPV